MAGDLEGRIAAVTGAASGIGKASAEAMLSAGARVVLVDRDESGLAAFREAHGDRVETLVLDLLDTGQCAALLPEILKKTGRIDILHANAGTYVGGQVVDVDTATIDNMLTLNINAVIKNIRDVLPHMMDRGEGDVIVTNSVAGHFPVPWEPVYSASKWALTSFVQTLRRQINGHGIRVGAVSPGPVATALLADWPGQSLAEQGETDSLMDPGDVAEAILFMLTRPRHVSIRDIIILPTRFDI